MIEFIIIISCIIIIFTIIVLSALFVYAVKNKPKHFCDLYEKSKLLDTGLCSVEPDCRMCPHRIRLV